MIPAATLILAEVSLGRMNVSILAAAVKERKPSAGRPSALHSVTMDPWANHREVPRRQQYRGGETATGEDWSSDVVAYITHNLLF